MSSCSAEASPVLRRRTGSCTCKETRRAACRVTLVEADDRLGGKIVTERVDGFVIEGGPDSFLATKPRGIGLCEELGIGDRPPATIQGVQPQRRRAFVLWRGRLHDLPEGLSGLVPTRLAPLARSTLLSPRGKLEWPSTTCSPRDVRQATNRSAGSFAAASAGSLGRLVEPLMAGIYAADGDQLSLAATFPHLREAERRYGGLIKGVLAARRQGPARRSPRFSHPPPVSTRWSWRWRSGSGTPGLRSSSAIRPWP